MLSTLERGVQGGKWFSLCDKAFSLKSLSAAFAKVKANAGSHGVDGISVARFEELGEENLIRLHRELMDGSYRPRPVRRVWIPKPGTSERRPLGVPTVRDRVVQTAVKAALEPIFEREFCDTSFGFRPGRSCHQALSRVWRGLRDGKGFVVDADFRKFFDTIPHEAILRGLEEKVSDGRILDIVRLFLGQGVMDGLTWEDTEEGTPQGSVVSPLLANIALHGLDLLAKENGVELIRYADDFVALCTSLEEAESCLIMVREWTTLTGLNLHTEKTRIVAYVSGESFDFLGYTFANGGQTPRSKSIQNLRNAVRAKTPRNSGRSLAATVRDLNPCLRGWFQYFKAAPELVLGSLDSFVRRRLRAMLDVRIGKHPAYIGATLQRWPNAYFERAGLYSMAAAKRKRSVPSGANH
jgi:RNA-directed DNA polymerase